MKICIIGNSHAGSLKRAWNQMGESNPAVEIEFFAHRGAGMNQLAVRGKKLVAGNSKLAEAMRFTSGGKEEIVPDDYDTIILYGLGAKAYAAGEQVISSSQVRKATVNDLIRSLSFNLLHSILHNIRRVSNVSIYVGHTPLPAASTVQNRNDPAEYLEGIFLANEQFYNGHGAELLAQPLPTIVNGSFTDPVYTKGSKRLAIGDAFDDKDHPGSDVSHMNDEFGKLWLSVFLTRIRS